MNKNTRKHAHTHMIMKSYMCENHNCKININKRKAINKCRIVCYLLLRDNSRFDPTIHKWNTQSQQEHLSGLTLFSKFKFFPAHRLYISTPNYLQSPISQRKLSHNSSSLSGWSVITFTSLSPSLLPWVQITTNTQKQTKNIILALILKYRYTIYIIYFHSYKLFNKNLY